MTIAVVLSSNALAATELARRSVHGVGPAGPLITALLVFLLAYLHIVEASERDRPQLRSLLATIIVPLAVVFLAIIGYESLKIIGPL